MVYFILFFAISGVGTFTYDVDSKESCDVMALQLKESFSFSYPKANMNHHCQRAVKPQGVK